MFIVANLITLKNHNTSFCTKIGIIYNKLKMIIIKAFLKYIIQHLINLEQGISFAQQIHPWTTKKFANQMVLEHWYSE